MATTRTKHRIGGYRVIAPIGAGGFATVYRALDEETKDEVAIKVLAENHSLVPDTRRRFVDEVGLLATIDSPSIAKIYKVGETDTGQPYMVLELADRGDLRRRLEEIRGSHKVLNRADLTMLAHHLYDSLNTLHQSEIVHRDVSPGNILIRSRRTPGQRLGTANPGVTLLEPGERFLLADLGHAKDLIQASGFTAGGGTRGYASPEQIDDISVVDHRADIFSATAVIEWAAHDSEYAEGLEPFFDVGLAAEPDDRYDTMTDWHAAFCAALGSSGSKPEKATAPVWNRVMSTAGGMLAEPRRRRFAFPAVALAMAALLTYALVSQIDGGQSIESAEVAERDLLVVQAPDGSGSDDPDADPLLVTDEDTAPLTSSGDEPDTTVPDETTTTEAETTTTPTTASTTTIESTTTTEATTTTSELTSTTAQTTSSTETNPSDSPRARIEQPAHASIIEGPLVINGFATFSGGLSHVELIIRNEDTGQSWNPATEQFQDRAVSFTVPVSGDDITDAGWEYLFPEGKLESGEYLIRAWARGVGGEADRRGDAHAVLVP